MIAAPTLPTPGEIWVEQQRKHHGVRVRIHKSNGHSVFFTRVGNGTRPGRKRFRVFRLEIFLNAFALLRGA